MCSATIVSAAGSRNNMKLRPDRRLVNVLRVRSLISTERDFGSYL
jgi:hypothetical protein